MPNFQEEEEEDYEDEVDGGKNSIGSGLMGNTLIQRSFGGLLDTTYQCLNCGETSTNRDTFRDVSLSFGMVSGGREGEKVTKRVFFRELI